MKTKKLYKFLRTNLKSDNGKNRNWKIGEWKKEEKLEMCKSGFHASRTPLQAFEYVKGEILAEVEARGESIIEYDKECWSEMRILKAWHWTKEDSVSLAIFAAEQVIDIFEKKYPNDDRPRKAIEAAKAWLISPTEENARAAHTASYAATYAAYAADAASYAAHTAADAASYAAHTAADAADARKKLIKKINIWFEERITNLTKYE